VGGTAANTRKAVNGESEMNPKNVGPATVRKRPATEVVSLSGLLVLAVAPPPRNARTHRAERE